MDIHSVQNAVRANSISSIPMHFLFIYFSSAVLSNAPIKDLSQPVPLHLVAMY